MMWWQYLALGALFVMHLFQARKIRQLEILVEECLADEKELKETLETSLLGRS